MYPVRDYPVVKLVEELGIFDRNRTECGSSAQGDYTLESDELSPITVMKGRGSLRSREA